ncbi:DUF2182 domain-containing protein [Marinobacter lipolyticus]|uniref:DUF2182 domain-containing protein n=1 Tax=Marinobacter lipolyticus TaxID=209639 RepID=UPI003A9575FB
MEIGVKSDQGLERVLRRDRWVVLALLTVVIVASWSYLLAGAGMDMSAMASTDWSPGYAIIMFLMWWIMMIAMMLPGATPMILLFASVNRRQRTSGNPYVPTTLFTASYLLAWAGFSLLATVLHWGIKQAGLLADMALTNQLLGAGILMAAGIYQLTPLKQACLRHCRMPAMYIATHWRPGTRGAFIMGLQHGVFCLGCCWVLMLLLFFGGVMNLYWIAGLAVYVLIEKTIPTGNWLDYGLGVVLVAVGAWFVVS